MLSIRLVLNGVYTSIIPSREGASLALPNEELLAVITLALPVPPEGVRAPTLPDVTDALALITEDFSQSIEQIELLELKH